MKYDSAAIATQPSHISETYFNKTEKEKLGSTIVELWLSTLNLIFSIPVLNCEQQPIFLLTDVHVYYVEDIK
jgi:hypothetical protein